MNAPSDLLFRNALVFDGSGAPYHGKVKTFAEAAREGGLQF